MEDKILNWMIELQSIAQAGLEYSKDVYDIERFERLREIVAEIISYKTELPIEKIKDLFCSEKGYQTPKLDTRAAIFEDNKILLVKENNGKWAMPGGWVDVLETVKSNTEKEVREEAGLNVIAKRIIAIHDKDKHNKKTNPYRILKIFVLCTKIDGEFKENSETIESRHFSLEEIPELEEGKTSKEQIEMCFKAKDNENWKVEFD